MPYVEVIYETGNSGIAYYDTDEEAKSALEAHNLRAINGQVGGPVGQPAERIKRALSYDVHPNEYNPTQTLSAEVALSEVTSLITAAGASNDGVIPIDQLAAMVRGLTHPHVEGKENSFDSNFKMKEKGELKLNLAGGN